MKSYHGSCHCGSISFTFSLPAVHKAMRCDCSICARKGSILTSDLVPPDRITISVKEDMLSTYRFGTMTAQHHFCKNCGIHTFVETRLNPGHFRINLGCVDGLDALRIPAEIYSGRAL